MELVNEIIKKDEFLNQSDNSSQLEQINKDVPFDLTKFLDAKDLFFYLMSFLDDLSLLKFSVTNKNIHVKVKSYLELGTAKKSRARLIRMLANSLDKLKFNKANDKFIKSLNLKNFSLEEFSSLIDSYKSITMQTLQFSNHGQNPENCQEDDVLRRHVEFLDKNHGQSYKLIKLMACNAVMCVALFGAVLIALLAAPEEEKARLAEIFFISMLGTLIIFTGLFIKVACNGCQEETEIRNLISAPGYIKIIQEEISKPTNAHHVENAVDIAENPTMNEQLTSGNKSDIQITSANGNDIQEDSTLLLKNSSNSSELKEIKIINTTGKEVLSTTSILGGAIVMRTSTAAKLLNRFRSSSRLSSNNHEMKDILEKTKKDEDNDSRASLLKKN